MIGNIILLNRTKGGIFSSCQRFFTKMNYTHCTFTVDMMGIESVLSSDEKVVILPLQAHYDEDGTEIETYKVIAPEELKEEAIKKLYKKYAGEWYGFTQLLWFVYKWAMLKFGKDVRKSNNPFKKGIICSELVYYYLQELLPVYPEINKELEEFTPDTVHAGDIAMILRKYPEIFIKI